MRSLPGTIRVTVIYINDHGSDVEAIIQEAYKVNGQLRGGLWEDEWFNWEEDHRQQRRPDTVDGCVPGQYFSFAYRIKETDGTPGPWSVAPPILCP